MCPDEVADRLVAHEMEADLGRVVVGRQIIVLDETGSTNDAILEIALPRLGCVCRTSNRWARATQKSVGIRCW